MSPLFASRRSADEFQALLDDGAHGSADNANAPALRIVDSLVSLGQAPVPLRSEFAGDLRDRLMVEAEDVLSAVRRAPAPREREHVRDRRLAVALGGIAIVGATTSVGVAAHGTLPGEPLYPIKRVIESAQIQVTTDEDDKGEVLLTSARNRLEEVDALSRQADPPEVLVLESALDDFTDQSRNAADVIIDGYLAGGEVAQIQDLRNFARNSRVALASLERVVPAQVRPAVVDASIAVAAISNEAQQACGGCAQEMLPLPDNAEGDGVGALTTVLTKQASKVKIPGSGSDSGPGSVDDSNPTAQPAPAPEPAEPAPAPTTAIPDGVVAQVPSDPLGPVKKDLPRIPKPSLDPPKISVPKPGKGKNSPGNKVKELKNKADDTVGGVGGVL